ncbi:hypothetical protein IFM89_036730 [Coptis chinensis]|uniref:Uncharacterized protein n=1 Tax=Coptis chinensis TaxID=261450 RepID=A0A835I7P6_9MAGN|nr:hypothetical protein IFM89_036730 [Coptis chinensis]
MCVMKLDVDLKCLREKVSSRLENLASSSSTFSSEVGLKSVVDLVAEESSTITEAGIIIKRSQTRISAKAQRKAASAKFVMVVDDTKLVSGLGGSGLAMAVEVVQFCWKYNLVRLQEIFKGEGCEAKLRVDGDGKPYVTDNSTCRLYSAGNVYEIR